MTLDDIHEEYLEFRDPEDVVRDVLRPWAAMSDGKVIECSSYEQLRDHATIYDEGGTWFVASSVHLTNGLEDQRPPKGVHSIFVAGDLVTDGRLTIGASLLVGGTIRCESLYKNAEVDCAYAHAVEAERYIFVQYPGAHFVADKITAPLVFFSVVAWSCPTIDSEIFLPDYMPKKLESESESFCRIVGIERARVDEFVQARDGEVMDAMTEVLEEGGLPPAAHW